MTKEEWTAVEKAISSLFCRAHLKCDGYDVELALERFGNRLVIVIYINGCWKALWLCHDSQAEETRRFMCPALRYVNSPSLRADLIKIYGGKRCPKDELARINKKFTVYRPYWTNATALRRHLVKHNQVIELVKVGGI